MRQFKKTLNDFALWSCAGGIPNLGRAKTYTMRLFWGFLFAVCFALCFYQTSIQVEKFLSYPFNLQTKLLFQTLAFPAVTICHLNPYKKSAAMANHNLTALINGFDKAVAGQLTQEEDQWNFLRGSETHMSKQTTARNSMLFYVAAMSPSEKQRISYTQAELISSCTFNQKPCKGLKTAFYPTYGNCFTFNPEVNLKSSRTGQGYGLRLLLITDTREYLPFTESAGVRITVSGKDDATGIFPDSAGCSAGTGFATSFTIQYMESKRLGPPYSECSNEVANYSAERCTRACMQRHVYSKCRCSAPTFDAMPGTQYCTISSADCINDAVTEFRNPPNETGSRASLCGCRQPCEELTYKLTASTATWPSKLHETFHCEGMTAKECREWYGRNALLVQVFYERMDFQSIKESETYTFTGLISDFGGNMGLWIGFSTITCVEVLFLPAMLCSKCLKNKKSQEGIKSLGAVETDYSDERDNEFDKVGGDHDPPPPFSGEPFEFRAPTSYASTTKADRKEMSFWKKAEKKDLEEVEEEKDHELIQTLANVQPPSLR